ncbi:MAG: helix-turn-helix domain-containing protein [Dactylosporangium sp.]|nr:helix-turn-helix domain-containing protein [Dactylosporangium sp.]NNJ63478.1 helix-turn-helix domain-containing protein [Dactylosporangium sp.]
MGTRQGPTLRAQWLGQQLKELRERAGFTLRQTADFLERDPSTISRIESAEYPVRRADLMALLDFYPVSDRQRRDALLALREDIWRKGWWDGYAEDVDHRLIDYVWLESRARAIHTFDNTLLPGLLQTREYAREAIVAADFDASTDQIERWVELRMARQGILNGEKPPQLLSAIDEGVLRRIVGGTKITQAQLRRLAGCAEQPNVEIRVLPFQAGAHTSPIGTFRILVMPEPYPDVAYAETLTGAVYVESPHVERLAQAYARLRDAALGPDESIELILALAKELH